MNYMFIHNTYYFYLSNLSQITSAFSDFYKEMRNFLKSSEETVSQIEKPFMFRTPNIIPNYTIEELAQERSFVIEAEELTNEWIDMISDLLDKTIKKVLYSQYTVDISYYIF